MNSGDLYKPYRTTLLSAARVREMSQLRPARVIRDVALSWAIILLAWAFVAVFPEWWAVLLTVPVIGARYYALFIIGHDGLHRRLFAHKQTNDRFNDLFIMAPIGAITRINNLNHLKHHLHLGTEEDPDRSKHACFNKTDHNELFIYLIGIFSVFKTLLNVFVKPVASPERPSTEAEPRRAAARQYTPADLALLLGWQIALFGGLTLSIGWWAYPVLWLAPVFLGTYLADNLRSFIEHSHPENDASADEHRLITHLSNPIERFFIAPMNMNYHAVHHLWPSIPYYNLKIVDEEIRRHPDAEGLVWRKSYLGYLWRYMRALPLEDCKVQAQSQPARA